MKTDALTTRYVEALFAAACDCGERERIGADLDLVLRELDEDAAFDAFLRDRSISATHKKKLLQTVFGATLHPYTLNYLSLLLDKGRIALLASSAAAYQQRAMEAGGRLAAALTTAAPLPEAQEEKLAAALGKVYDKRVEFSCAVDPALLGGAVVQIGDIIIDGSVRTQLQALRRDLLPNIQAEA